MANQLSNAGHSIVLAPQGDFEIDGTYTFEVGGLNKKKMQIAHLTHAWVVRDNMEVGYTNIIPLWLFGFFILKKYFLKLVIFLPKFRIDS